MLAARSCPRPGSSSSVARRMSSVAAQLPNSNAPMPANRRPSPPRSTGRTCRRIGRSIPRARSPHAPHSGEHRERREQTRHDRDEHRRAHVEDRDQRDREQGTHDRAEVVRRALEPVGPPVRLGRHDVGEDRVAARTAHPARSPGAGSQHEHLPRRRREPDAAREHRGRHVAADRDLRAALRVVGERAAGRASQRPPRRRRRPRSNPNADAGAPSVTVRKLGSSDVGISCPTSERKLASPIDRTPG